MRVFVERVEAVDEEVDGRLSGHLRFEGGHEPRGLLHKLKHVQHLRLVRSTYEKSGSSSLNFFLLTTKNTLHKHSQKNLLHPLDQILISMSDLDKHAKYSQFKQYN